MPADNKFEDMWRRCLNVNFLKKGFFSTGYNLDMTSYADDHVKNAYLKRGQLLGVATDYDSDHEYHPVIDITDGNLEFNCSCMSMSYMHTCAHCVALLIYGANNLDKLIGDEQNRKKIINFYISKVSANQANDFLIHILNVRPLLINAFIKRYNLYDLQPPRDYAGELKRFCNASLKNSKTADLSTHLLSISEMRDQDDSKNVAAIYKDVSEALRPMVDASIDTTGYYADCCIEAIENMAESVMREKFELKEKRKYIKFLIDEAVTVNNSKIIPYYRSALEMICNEPEDLVAWEKMVISRIAKLDAERDKIRASGKKPKPKPSSFIRSAVQDIKSKTDKFVKKEDARKLGALQLSHDILTGMHAHVLAQTNRVEQALSVLRPRAFESREVCITYLHILRSIDAKDEYKGALDAVTVFPEDVQIINAVMDLFPLNSPQRVNLSIKAFKFTGEVGYLDEIKRNVDDWDAVFSDMIDNLAKQNLDKAVEVCIKNGPIEKVINILENSNDVWMFKKYSKKVRKRNSELYAISYGKALVVFASGKSGKDHYIRVTEHLDTMSKMSVSESIIVDIITHIISKNKNKRLLVDMLKRYISNKQVQHSK